MPTSERALGLALGALADAVFGDPQRWHPVAGFGRLAAALERLVWANSRARGVAYVGACVGIPAAFGVVAERLAPRGVPRVLVTAVCTWAVLGGRSLAHEAAVMAALLESGDVAGGRRRLSHLAGRDATGLDMDELARASVESVAENTSDAVVAPLIWGAVAGLPGLLGYRAANTLDAMVGHRTPRYLHFGWATARFDDLANLVPARVAALLAAALAPVVGGRPVAALRVWRRDAHQHPSPNAGPVESSFAGALGVRLGGSNAYEGRVEHRGTLGDGPAAGVRDLPRAIRLAVAIDVAAVAGAAALAWALNRR